MIVTQKSNDVLVVKTEMILFVIFGAAFLLLGGLAVSSSVAHGCSLDNNAFVGRTGAATTFLLMALFFFDISEFAFDRRRRVVIWKKRTVFTNRSGILDFDEIKTIRLQSLRDTDNVRTVRVAIITKSGELPLTKSYTGNTSQMTRIAERLNHWVFNQDPDLIKANIRASLAGGYRAEAALTLRRAFPLSMKEAAAFLDHPEKLDELGPADLTKDDDINAGDKNLVLGLVALITLVCGPLALILGGYGCYRGLATTHWPQTQAVIKTSGMHRQEDSNERRFALQYTYEVAGEPYTANALYMGPVMNKQKDYPVTKKFYLKDNERIKPGDYKPGKVITISYNPDDPASAVVIAGVSGGSLAMFIAGLLLTLGYLILARRDLRHRAKKKLEAEASRSG